MFRVSECGVPEPFRGFHKINQTFLRRHVEQAQRTGDPESLTTGNTDALALVDQHDIGVKKLRQGDSGSFSLMESGYLGSPVVSWISSHSGGTAIQLFTGSGARDLESSDWTALGRATRSNNRGSRSMCPMRMR